MEDLRSFIELSGLDVDIQPEIERYKSLNQRLKRTAEFGGATALLGYGMYRANKKGGEFIMTAGVTSAWLFGLFTWSYKDRVVTDATDKMIFAIQELKRVKETEQTEPAQAIIVQPSPQEEILEDQ